MDRRYPVIFLLVLGLSAPAAAAEGNRDSEVWLDPVRVEKEMDICIAKGWDFDPSVSERCSDEYYERCTDSGRRTSTLDMMFCQRALKEYWQETVSEREQAAIALGNQRTTEWVQTSHGAWKAYQISRCSRLHMSKGSMFGPIFENCMMETARDRAVDLADFLGEQPLIVPEPE